MLSIEMYTAIPNGTLPPNYKQCAMQDQSLNDLICNNPAGGDIYYGIEGKGLVRIDASKLSSPNKFSCTSYGSRTPDDAPITLPEDIDDPDPHQPKFCYAPENTNTIHSATTSNNRWPTWKVLLGIFAVLFVLTFIGFALFPMINFGSKSKTANTNINMTLSRSDARTFGS